MLPAAGPSYGTAAAVPGPRVVAAAAAEEEERNNPAPSSCGMTHLVPHGNACCPSIAAPSTVVGGGDGGNGFGHKATTDMTREGSGGVVGAASGAGGDAGHDDGGAAAEESEEQKQGERGVPLSVLLEIPRSLVPSSGMVVKAAVPRASPQSPPPPPPPVPAPPAAGEGLGQQQEEEEEEEEERPACAASTSSSSSSRSVGGNAPSLPTPPGSLSSDEAAVVTDAVCVAPPRPQAVVAVPAAGPSSPHPVRPFFMGEQQQQQQHLSRTAAAPMALALSLTAALSSNTLPCPASLNAPSAPEEAMVVGTLAQEEQGATASLTAAITSLPCDPAGQPPLERVVGAIAASLPSSQPRTKRRHHDSRSSMEAEEDIPLESVMATLPLPSAAGCPPLEEAAAAVAADLLAWGEGSKKGKGRKRPRSGEGVVGGDGRKRTGSPTGQSSSSGESEGMMEIAAAAGACVPRGRGGSGSSDSDTASSSSASARSRVPPCSSSLSMSSASSESSDSSDSSDSEDDDAPVPCMGLDSGPTRTGVVIGPKELEAKMRVHELRQHFEDLKQTYLLMQGVTRTMRGQHNTIVNPPAAPTSNGGGASSSTSASRAPSPVPTTTTSTSANPAAPAAAAAAGGAEQQGAEVSMSAIFPEMWRPFDSSKTWPMCIFYRNPALDPRVYLACRSESNSVFGDHTSPRQDDPAWNGVIEAGLVGEVRAYLERHREEFKLGEKVPFSIQALWYDRKTRKAEHKDPKAYSVISALNVQGEADLQLYDPVRRRRHQSILLPEGSLYVMHNEAVTKLDHAVSAPHAAFKDNRVTLVLRFIDRRSLKHLQRQIQRVEQATLTLRVANNKMGGGGGNNVGAGGGGGAQGATAGDACVKSKQRQQRRKTGKKGKKAAAGKKSGASKTKKAKASSQQSQARKPTKQQQRRPKGPLTATIEERQVLVRLVLPSSPSSASLHEPPTTAPAPAASSSAGGGAKV